MCKEFEEEKDFCCHCGIELSEENVFEFNGEVYCENCLNERTFICSHCGERYPNDENMGDNSINLCENCFDYYYTRCENCGRIIQNDSAYYLDDEYKMILHIILMMIITKNTAIARTVMKEKKAGDIFTITAINPTLFSEESGKDISVWNLKLTMAAKMKKTPVNCLMLPTLIVRIFTLKLTAV